MPSLYSIHVVIRKHYLKIISILTSAITTFLFTPASCQEISASIDLKSFNPAEVLWYTSPANAWEEALPVGNGRLGAMVFGKTDEERIQLNEDTYWTGGPYSTVVKGGYKTLPQIQTMIFKGDIVGAHKLFGRYLMGYPVEQQKYQSLGNLILQTGNSASVTGYKRWLDMGTGITGTEYVAGGVKYFREVFSSAPDQAIVVRLSADKPGSISLQASLRGVRNSQMSNYATDYFRMDGQEPDQLVLKGKSADYMGITGRLKYEARLLAVPDGGRMSIDGDELIIEKADAVTLYVVAATNFVDYKNVGADEHKRVEDYLSAINSKNYNAVRKSAVDDYRKLFSRVVLKLGTTDNSFLPTDIRMKKIQDTPDPSLAALCYQFGRYLMISSSRPGTQPANLQGIWNQDMNPPWDSKYTTNINTEMSYWPVET